MEKEQHIQSKANGHLQHPLKASGFDKTTEGTTLPQPPFQLQTSDGTPPNKPSAKPNDTGLPDSLKTGVESLSGYSMDDVKVHYNSDKPAQLQAHAYAQGTDIHLASGQEKHLPHETWHVAQQKQGRVKPTMQLKGQVNVNDDAGLEKEADEMGAKAATLPRHSPNKADHKQHETSKNNTVQRVVTVISESDPNALWGHVRGLVKSVYRRRKTLFEWAARPNDYLNFDSYESLAASLDSANQSKASLGRNRPDWTPKIKSHFDKTWGGKRHRRHIIMSSLMRDAVYAVSDNPQNDQVKILEIYNHIIASAGFNGYDPTNAEQTESALVYVLHNNPANLVLDSGAENSAIGSLAHNFHSLLEKDDSALQTDFAAFEKDPNTYLRGIVRGFQPGVQMQIMDTVSTFPLPGNITMFREFIEMIYDNTAVDVMTNVTLPSQAGNMLGLHSRFVAAQSSSDLQILYGTAMTYVKKGVEFKECPYPTIW